jgi:hypothetical protein
LIPPANEKSIRSDGQRSNPALCHRCKAAIDILFRFDAKHHELLAYGARGCL